MSFYNESQGRDIDPTPVIGVLGLIESLDAPPPPPALAWFSESASRVVLSVTPERVAAAVDRARAAGVEAAELGEATGDRIVAEGAFDVALAAATRTWRDAIPSRLGVDVPTR